MVGVTQRTRTDATTLCAAEHRTRYKCNTQETSTGWSWSRLCVPLALHWTYISRLLFAFGKGLGNRAASPLLFFVCSSDLPVPLPPVTPCPSLHKFRRGLGHLLCSACLASTRPWDRSNLTQSKSEPGGSWRRTHKGNLGTKWMSTLLYKTFGVAYTVLFSRRIWSYVCTELFSFQASKRICSTKMLWFVLFGHLCRWEWSRSAGLFRFVSFVSHIISSLFRHVRGSPWSHVAGCMLIVLNSSC